MEPLHRLSSLSYSPTTFSGELFSPKTLDVSRRSEKPYEHSESKATPEQKCLLPESTLQVMLEKEASDYRGQCLQDVGITEETRVLSWFRRMAKWCYDVADCTEVPAEVVDLTFSLLDRFLICNGMLMNQCDILNHSDQFKLVVMACLYIASKAVSPVSLAPVFFEETSGGDILAEDIEATEMVILCDLDFLINPSTIASFAQYYVQEQLQLWDWNVVEGSEEELEQRSLFLHLVDEQARLAVTELYTLSIPTSVVALACAKNALEVMENYRALPVMDTPLKETAHEIAMLNLQAKVRKSSNLRKPDFESLQEQLQSNLLMVALQECSKRKSLAKSI